MAETRIALIMGGGVSLGSFSGGALAEVIKLLKHTERGPAKIDVVSGASAGSMTLGVVVYHLLKGSSDEEIEKALHDAWVKQISIENLYPEKIRTHDQASFFSNKIIQDIANGIIDTENWPDNNQPHPLFADGMKISFSLTNLNGIPIRAEGQIIRQPSSGGGQASGKSSVFADAVQTTFHQDNIRFVVRQKDGMDDEFESSYRVLRPWVSDEEKKSWDVFRNGSIASGAFPGAFPPERILRNRHEFGKYWPDDLQHSDHFRFDYLDGGILRNEPLREAIHMAGEQDKGQNVERVFIFIDPNVSGTSEVYSLSFNQPLALNEVFSRTGHLKEMNLSSPNYIGRLMGVFGRFAGVLASQAAFRDWLKAAHYNSMIEWRDELLGLLDQVQPKPDSNIEKELDQLLESIYEEKILRSMGSSVDSVDSDVIKKRVHEEINSRVTDNEEKDLFNTKLRLAIDLVANLRDKRKLNMVAITPASIEEGGQHPIAGNFLRSFGGFFEERFRQHDFDVGRHIAAKVLNASIGDAKPFLKEKSEIPSAPAPFDPEPHYRELDNLKRARFEKLIDEHLDISLPIPGIIRGYVRKKIVEKISNSLLSDIDGQVRHVYMRFENVDERRYLKGNSADDKNVNSNGIIDTVVGVRKRLEGGVSYQMYGPHLHTDENGKHFLELYRNRRTPFRSGEKQGRIYLQGEPADWYQTIYCCSSPCIIRDMKQDKPFGDIKPDKVKPDFLSRFIQKPEFD